MMLITERAHVRWCENIEQRLTRIYSKNIIWNRECFSKEAVCIVKDICRAMRTLKTNNAINN